MSLILALTLALSSGPPLEAVAFREGTAIHCYYAPNIEERILDWLATMHVPIPLELGRLVPGTKPYQPEATGDRTGLARVWD